MLLQTPVVKVNLEECQECFGYGPHEIRLGSSQLILLQDKKHASKKKRSESIRFVPGSSNIKAGEVSELRPKDEDSRVLCSQ